MQTVLIVIHLLIVIALVGVILIQRSEGGGLGIGGGSGFMTARGAKNALTRVTAILAACFFITSVTLVVMTSVSNPTSDILKRIPDAPAPAPSGSAAPALTVPLQDGKQPTILQQLGGQASDPAATVAPSISVTVPGQESKPVEVKPAEVAPAAPAEVAPSPSGNTAPKENQAPTQ